jgi:hypothetical protein
MKSSDSFADGISLAMPFYDSFTREKEDIMNENEYLTEQTKAPYPFHF